ncbi:MAG: hypothetical protein JO161_04895 [Planctomycetaceae bacterium]|nr:hypothetical protein [Planctomycetaceae bacterium]
MTRPACITSSELTLYVGNSLKRRVAVLAAARGQTMTQLCLPLLEPQINNMYKRLDLHGPEPRVNGTTTKGKRAAVPKKA